MCLLLEIGESLVTFFYCIVGSVYSVICLELVLCVTYYTLVQRAYLIHCSLLNFCLVMFVANKNLGSSVYCILCSVLCIETLVCSVD